ncbi:hypothetical protein HY643_03325 [Candidatus Woesearchaeota archaeon]|nr:hypothetical protein [Candidatus Woesearchaeota archaeon]
MEITPLILAFLLSTLHFFSHISWRFVEKFHTEIISFSSGLFLSLIFLRLFPEIIKPSISTGILFFFLVGFVIFHLLEKYFYQHVKNKSHLMKDLKKVHIVGFFIDHFIIGFFLVAIYTAKTKLGFLVFLPLALHTLSSSMALDAIQQESEAYTTKIVLSLSTIIGAIIAAILISFTTIFYAIFALCVGAILYVVVRDMLPEKADGSTKFFVIGVILNIALIFISGV